MQRLIGSVLIITATAGAGYVYGTELKKYLEKIQYLRYISGLLKGEIEYTGAPLSEVFSSVAARCRPPPNEMRHCTSAPGRPVQTAVL